MQRRITPRSLGRAQWFSDLLVALNEAERLLALLEVDRRFPDETARLRQRILALSSELELLDQVARGKGRVIGNSWPEPMHAGAAEA
jgi:hypothetical protein